MLDNEMNLFAWLKENNMSISDFSKKIKCHRQTARFIEAGKPVCLRIALAVKILTDGKVNPAVKNVGRPKLINKSTVQ